MNELIEVIMLREGADGGVVGDVMNQGLATGDNFRSGAQEEAAADKVDPLVIGSRCTPSLARKCGLVCCVDGTLMGVVDTISSREVAGWVTIDTS